MSKENKKINNQAKEIQVYIRKPEFWIGLVTVALFVLVMAKFAVNRIKTSKVFSKRQVEKFVSPIPTTITTITPTPEVKIKVAAQVKKFPDTGSVKYTVIDGDNYWKISGKVCGNGRYFKSIEAQNGGIYRSLQIGDVITVECHE